MSRLSLPHLLDRLSDRDLRILNDLASYRLLTTRQIQRLHFGEGHDTVVGATRACIRVLCRLREHGLVDHLPRRIGGVRQGSSGFVWHLAASGDRVVRSSQATPGGRRRYLQPSPRFTDHTVGVAELAVRLTEVNRAGSFDLTEIRAEPATWRSFLGAGGSREWLKPDMLVVTRGPEYEDHWYLEWDNGSEHIPAIERQAAAYVRYRDTGHYQAAHGLFPAVLWVAANTARAAALAAALTACCPPDAPALFRGIPLDALVVTIAGSTYLGDPSSTES